MQQYTYPQYRQYIPRPVITEDTIRRDTQKKLRKRCTAVGFYALTYTATMYVLSIGLLLLFQTLGISTDETLTQLQDIFISVGAAFIPGILFIAATGFKFREAFGKTTVGATTLIPLILMGMAVAMASNYAADIFETNLSIFGLQNTAGSVESSAMTPFEIILNNFLNLNLGKIILIVSSQKIPLEKSIFSKFEKSKSFIIKSLGISVIK